MPKPPAIDHDAIRDLARLLDETGLSEIEYQHGGVSIRVARYAPAPRGRAADGSAVAAATAAAPFVSPVAATVAASIDPTQHPGLIVSPMVGTAYRGSAPGARPFVEIGTAVKAGDTLIIIEAMKTMDQIPAPHAGTVTQILIDDGQPVEYGEPLMIVE